jgi:hypothetical protein
MYGSLSLFLSFSLPPHLILPPQDDVKQTSDSSPRESPVTKLRVCNVLKKWIESNYEQVMHLYLQPVPL